MIKSKLEEMKKNVHGSTMTHITKNNFDRIKCNIPTMNKQQEIVSILDKINAIIDADKKQLELLDETVKSRFIEMFGEPKANPKHFDIKKIEELFDVGSSKRVFESQWTDSGVPFYRAREIVKLSKDGFVDNELFITREMFEEYKKKYGVPKENDMMVTGVGTLGICYIVKDSDEFYFKDGNTLWFKNKGLCDVRFIRDQYDTDFVREQIDSNANASTVGTYTITNAKNTLVLVPPFELQKQYVKYVEQIDKSKFNVQQHINLMQELLDKKMEEFFGGVE
jgi:type I restriction enzyme S subunit